MGGLNVCSAAVMVSINRERITLGYLLAVGLFSLSLLVPSAAPAAGVEDGVSATLAERALDKIKEGRGNARAIRYANAAGSLRAAVALAEEAGASMVLAIALHNLAEVYRLQENKLDALKYYYQANKIYSALGNKAGIELTRIRIDALIPDSPRPPASAGMREPTAPPPALIPETDNRMSRIESAVERIRKRVTTTAKGSSPAPSAPPGQKPLVPVTQLKTTQSGSWSQAYRQYVEELGEQIERIWRYPESAIRKHETGNAEMEFTITKNGELERVRILQSSGFSSLDLESLRTVRAAAPFKPLPAAAGLSEATVRFTFSYRFHEDSPQITNEN